MMRRTLTAILLALAAAASSHAQTNADAARVQIYEGVYGQLNRFDKVEEMLTRRGEDATVDGEKRADAFIILASRRWWCSYEITERKENKQAVSRRNKVIIRYERPADPADFKKARWCADEGLRLSDRALALAPQSVNVWSYRAHLLREEAKLAEMEGNAARKNEYNRRSLKALDEQKRLMKEEERKREAKREADSTASVAQPPPPHPGRL